MTDLLVLGAGPAGLGAAYRAARQGRAVTVLERADRVGGAAGSFELAGVRVDHGSHRLHPSTAPAVAAVLRELLGDELQLRRRNGRIRLDGRWVGFPLQLADAARSLAPGFLAGAARDAALAWARRPRAATYAEHLRAGLGPTLCEHFYFPYARKLWGLPPEQLSVEQARRRVSADGPAKLARRLLRGRQGQGRTFWYPRRGFGQISERLAEAAVEAGAELHLGTPVEQLTVTDDAVTVTAGGQRLSAPLAWSTLPLTALPALVAPCAPAAVAEAAGALEHRALLLVYLVVAGDRYTDFDAHYLPSAALPVSRVSEPKNYRDGAGLDPADCTVLCAEVPCAVGDELWGLDDEAAATMVSEALAACGLPQPAVLGHHVERIPKAYPIYRRGFEDHFAALDDWLAGLPRLLTFGRQGLFAHDNTHHALAMAWAAADSLTAQGTVDRSAWARSREAFAAHVVED